MKPGHQWGPSLFLAIIEILILLITFELVQKVSIIRVLLKNDKNHHSYSLCICLLSVRMRKSTFTDYG